MTAYSAQADCNGLFLEPLRIQFLSKLLIARTESGAQRSLILLTIYVSRQGTRLGKGSVRSDYFLDLLWSRRFAVDNSCRISYGGNM